MKLERMRKVAVGTSFLMATASCGGVASNDGGVTDGNGNSGSNDGGSNGGGSNDGGSNGGGSNDGGSNGGSSGLIRYTPEQANWSTFASKPLAARHTAHDPNSVEYLTAASWDTARWDGTVYNPSRMSRADFFRAICPHVDQVRGIREVFYAQRPFADDRNPTRAEVDNWHRIAINHVRALVGYTSQDRQVRPDHCLFARALWGDQRQRSMMWDAEYPGVLNSAAGPCMGTSNPHCGATFLLSAEDQVPFLPEGHPTCTAAPGAEGIFSGPKSNIPWSVKWSRGLCNTLAAEGFWGGHVGPWFHRETFGFSFWDGDPANNGSVAILRAKWGGNSMPNLYCNPAEPGCDPANTGPGGR